MSSETARMLAASGLVRRRKRKSRFMELLAWTASGLAVAVLAVVTISVFFKGAKALDWDLLTKTQATFGETGGGIAHAIVGTAILIAIATGLSLPIGVLVAIYVSEFARPTAARAVKLALDVINGIPSIVIGIFVFALLVVGHGQKAIYGSIALAILMIPLVSRAAQEVLALVPPTLREASLALGVSRWRTVLRVIIPTTLGGILTGTILAIARAAGETAPLLFTSSVGFATNSVATDPSQSLASIPFIIYNYSEQPDPHLNDQAWAAAFLLIAFVLVTSLSARWLLHRSASKLRGERVGERRVAAIMARFARD